MGIKNNFNGIYNNKSIFVTGHTGFKGSWLSLWLQELGATVTGYSLPPITEPNHYTLLNLKMKSHLENIKDINTLKEAIEAAQPEIIFHLAAQPLVIPSYEHPLETFESNILGTWNILEAAKQCESVKAICMVTTDKCYLNKNTTTPYKETEPLGGKDPYSASKACSEILTKSYQHAFLSEQEIYTATCRGGNVIGGGDWSDYRLIPDLMKNTAKGQQTPIRNPESVRPWQHVLDCLSGYLLIGQHLLQKNKKAAEAWNVGPLELEAFTVKNIIDKSKKHWSNINPIYKDTNTPKEENLLLLDINKLSKTLHWTPIWDVATGVEKTISWYKSFYENNNIISLSQLESYCKEASEKGIIWAS